MNTDYLQQIGLTQIQQDLYLFLVQHGRSIASMLAKRLGYKRPTIYSALKSLQSKGLLKSYVSGSVTYFEATDPKELVHVSKLRIHKEEQLLVQAELMAEQLESVVESRDTSIQGISGDVKYFRGKEAVKKMLYESLDETVRSSVNRHLCIGSCLWDSAMDGHTEYVKKRVSLGIVAQMLVPESKRSYYESITFQNLYDLRFVVDEDLPLNAECDLMEDRINIYTLADGGKDIVGIKIYSQAAARVLLKLYELAWRGADK